MADSKGGSTTSSTLGPLDQPESLARMAYKALYQAILSGELKLGAVYREKELANYLQISRTPVREALLELSAKGLVTFLPRRGVRINQFDRRDLNEIFELRKALELTAVEKVASQAGPEEISRFRDILRQQQEHAHKQDMVGFLQKDREFHALLSHLTGNRRLMNTIEEVRDLIQIMGAHALIRRGRVEEVMQEHESLLQCIAHSDPEKARERMCYHLDQTWESAEKNLFAEEGASST
ncbi:MAG: GntR family transcriptional regulator [Desulfohalobiaceae bacterium]